ncbi:type II toxin-antitoxin system RelB/DinJ family antitoxin [Bifidobacterium pseudolongum]|uniref:type II toxin-antitoxin system RelB/DinJ family antitoxin n=1 Tax=Bifidobacterium pseudolongum TaxID=1694 RepID=UPI001022910A|nr:type II toxin-antitoxin system RelB/DinJ family antitoxin [Bifidobacterium pseudolongum]RYQ51734.1 damage-inducible protein J [Bifidobacterium pseudolongum subsp. pseudolongum]
MTMASVTVRVNAHTKEQAANIAEDFGLDLSSVTRAFYRQIVREHGIPLNLFYPDAPQETVEALDEARAIVSKKSARFDNADETFESLDTSHVEQ